MRDIKIDKWADVLVHYALEAEEGQHALLVGDVDALPLVEACYEKFVRAGIIVDPIISSKGWSEILFKYGSDKLIETTSPVLRYAAENCDLYLAIGADANSKLLTNVDGKRQMVKCTQGQS